MASWQAAEPGTVIGDGQGNYQMRVGGVWTPMPKGSLAADEHGAYHFNADLMTPPTAPKAPAAAPAEPSQFQGVADAAQGVGDAALSGATKVANSVVGAPISLVNRLVAAFAGGDPQVAADATHEYINRNFGHDTQTPIGKKIGAAVSDALAPLGQSINAYKEAVTAGGEHIGIPRGATENMLGTAGDFLGTAGVVAPILGGAAASDEAANLAASTAAAKAPAAVTKYGMTTGGDSTLAKNLAGASGRPTTAARNQAIANPILGEEAGVPAGTIPTKGPGGSLEAAQAGPNSVYQRAEQSLPTAPLSPAAQQIANGVNPNKLIVNSPNVTSMIEEQKARLLDGPLSGPDVVDAQKTLRYNGFKNIASQDPESVAVGQGQLKFADALHQHMLDTLPPDAPVSADQLNAARTALAKNHTIENVLGPKGNIDLTKLAKIHDDNPGMMSGPMAEIAQFAFDNPEVTKLPGAEEAFNPSGLAKDVASIDLKKPLSYIQPLVGGAARRAITGARPPPMMPTSGLGAEFGPIERGPPQPPAGMTASPPEATPAPAAGPPGQIPLSDLLAHGVEQSPAQGLSLAPAPSVPAGIPFARNAAHEAGPLSLVDDLVGPSTQSLPKDNNSDLAKVKAEGVPTGDVQRAPQNAGLKMPVAHSPAFISNNGSVESAASQEAINRGSKPLVEIDPDGRERPVMKGVGQADVNPAPGHIIVDKSTGQVVNSGRMAPALARGLLNRWKSMQLGSQF